MSPRSRTNQLLYQAELLVGLPVGDDERRFVSTAFAVSPVVFAIGNLNDSVVLVGQGVHVCDLLSGRR